MACCMSSHHDADIEALPPTEQVINEERRCTDVSFLCLFAAFWVGMLAISIKAFIKGDTNRILYGLDMDGNVCGAKNSGVNGSSGPNFTDRKNLYWLDPYDFLLDEETHIYKTVCLVSCPNDTSSYVCTYRGQWETSYFSNLTGTEMTSSLIGTGPCYRVILPTFTILNKCFPIPPAELLNDAMGSNVASNSTLSTMKSILLKVSKDFNKGRLQQYLADIIKGWAIIVVCGLVGGLVLSFLWIFILRFYTGLMIWTTIILINVVFIAFTIICYVKAAKIPGSEIGRKLDEAIKPMPSLFDPSKNDKKIFLYIAYILSAFSGLLILFTLLLCQRVVIAIGCVKVASRAMESMPSILIFPFLPFLMAVMLVAWWLVVAIFLYSDSQVVKYSGGGYSLTWDYTTRYLLIYHLFGLLWTWQFIVGFSYVVIAGIFSSYYWCRGDSSLASSTMITSLYRAVTYHLGSIALGSLIVAVIQLVRMIFQYLNKKFKKLRSIAWLPSITMSCLGCCICALEKILKFVNRNAYIVIAMKGTNYCSSASRAVSLIISNALRVATVTIVGDVVIWLGKVFVSCTCGIAALLMSEAKMYSDASSRTYISSPLFPVIFSLIVAYFVAHLFMQLYDIGIDTILLCFCEDCERHNGSPSFAPPSLMTAVGALRKPTTAFE